MSMASCRHTFWLTVRASMWSRRCPWQIVGPRPPPRLFHRQIGRSSRDGGSRNMQPGQLYRSLGARSTAIPQPLAVATAG
jgi:hypothetical protein